MAAGTPPRADRLPDPRVLGPLANAPAPFPPAPSRRLVPRGADRGGARLLWLVCLWMHRRRGRLRI